MGAIEPALSPGT